MHTGSLGSLPKISQSVKN